MAHHKARRRPLFWFLVLGFFATIAAGGALATVTIFNRNPPPLIAACTAPLENTQYTLAPDQSSNAALIAAVADQRGLPPRAVTIAIAVAMQESKLRNISYGDRDSVGLFQQRPSQGWGSVEEIMNPEYAINAFFNNLVAIPGYEQMPITEAGQAVQLSAYPDAYAQHEPTARAFASALTGYSPAALNCTLPPSETTGDPGTIAQTLNNSFGTTVARLDGNVVRADGDAQSGWQFAQWAVAKASELGVKTVVYGGRTWQRDNNNDSGVNLGWQSTTETASTINTDPGTVTITT